MINIFDDCYASPYSSFTIQYNIFIAFSTLNESANRITPPSVPNDRTVYLFQHLHTPSPSHHSLISIRQLFLSQSLNLLGGLPIVLWRVHRQPLSATISFGNACRQPYTCMARWPNRLYAASATFLGNSFRQPYTIYPLLGHFGNFCRQSYRIHCRITIHYHLSSKLFLDGCGSLSTFHLYSQRPKYRSGMSLFTHSFISVLIPILPVHD